MSTTKTRTRKTAPKSNAAEDLRELFEEQLKDLYWAEKALTKALPKMAKNATAEELVTAINDHLDVTREQVARMEEVFSVLGKKPQAKKCEAMEGLIKEGEEMLEHTNPGAVRDAGIIAAAQKVEHYEIASYGTLVAFANILGEVEAADLLQLTLDEEKDADVTLTQVAENHINIDAAEAHESEESNGRNGSKTKKATAHKSALIHE
jgi:ferritin-like metal-binding protein YciE